MWEVYVRGRDLKVLWAPVSLLSFTLAGPVLAGTKLDTAPTLPALLFLPRHSPEDSPHPMDSPGQDWHLSIAVFPPGMGHLAPPTSAPTLQPDLSEAPRTSPTDHVPTAVVLVVFADSWAERQFRSP